MFYLLSYDQEQMTDKCIIEFHSVICYDPMPVDFPNNLLVVYNSKKEVTRPPHSKYIYMVSTCFQLLQSRTYLAPKLLAQHKELKALE